MRRTSLIAVLFAIIGALSAIDLFLARTENRETRAEAGHNFADGARLLAANRPEEAVDAFRKAYALDRSNQTYALQLAAAMIAAGKLDEAQSLLADLLQSSPNNGEANLLEARLLLRQERFEEAEPYFHRAIYGTWSENAAVRRVQVRLEFAAFLASRGAAKELLAELLPLETEAHDLPTRKRVAHLYMVANSPARAAAAYRDLIRDDPHDHSNQAGLGQAELALGDYRAAVNAFRAAGAADQAALASQVESLDPTPRRLSAAEKLARSTRILQLVRESLARCQAAPPPDPPARRIAAPTNEMAEERLALAEQIWAHRIAACGPGEESLNLVMSKVSGK